MLTHLSFDTVQTARYLEGSQSITHHAKRVGVYPLVASERDAVSGVRPSLRNAELIARTLEKDPKSGRPFLTATARLQVEHILERFVLPASNLEVPMQFGQPSIRPSPASAALSATSAWSDVLRPNGVATTRVPEDGVRTSFHLEFHYIERAGVDPLHSFITVSGAKAADCAELGLAQAWAYYLEVCMMRVLL